MKKRIRFTLKELQLLQLASNMSGGTELNKQGSGVTDGMEEHECYLIWERAMQKLQAMIKQKTK